MDDGLKRPIAEAGMRIGLFGGSFNPPHAGHRLVALECLKRLRLDRVWLLVTPGNPLKERQELAPLAERIVQTRALMSHPALVVTGFEAQMGFGYTYQTLEYLTQAEPLVKFVWLMGGDSLRNFHLWERWDEIAQLVPLAVYARPGSGANATRARAAVALRAFRRPDEEAEILAVAPPPAWTYLRGIMSRQSSSAIRRVHRSIKA